MSEYHLHPAPQDTASFEAAAQLFKYLSDPTRVRLFFILCHSEKCVIQLSECMEMSSPALSHHLRPLRAAGDTVEAQLFHKMIEQVLEIACPG